MVDLTETDPFDIDVPQPSVNIKVFGDDSIGDAFGGILEGIVGGFLSLMKKLVASETSITALANLTSLLIVIAALIIAYRSIGRK